MYVQARPRRRSGDQCGAQDLTKPPASPLTETAENLSMKKPAHQQHQQANNSSSSNNNTSSNNNVSSNGNITPAPTLPPAPPGTPVTSPHPLVRKPSNSTLYNCPRMIKAIMNWCI